jgi:hypothetical protein
MAAVKALANGGLEIAYVVRGSLLSAFLVPCSPWYIRRSAAAAQFAVREIRERIA